MVYYSQAWQDEFVANLLNFKKNGYFIDIGSSDGINQSNSNFFEKELGWQGICVERGVGYTEHYKNHRSCIFLNEDATEIDYRSILDDQKYPLRIDYLSLDVDESSALSLKKLPLDKYRFSVITIEHDAYRFGNKLKDEERSILKSHNYISLFSDVLVPLGCGMGPNLPFEDWWIDPITFNLVKLNQLAAKFANEKLYPDNIVNILKRTNDIYLV